ncbi:hypothetical protein IE044AEMC_01489 [Enterococcus faecalis]|uniref:hypothetical protein n=1 Tax=Enterococcus faecalis TaxID=1351 RepID=UPI00115DB8C9|nr:hypothetical protein [Enterococcus faecalis]MDN3136048.1 hypothetical protein [Enterococcus faecalis]CAC9764372.1 hypothetical protein IE313HC_01258 [Enterococcus faecalis]CAC9764667.1 hypothetical protein IE044AEGC_01323 [Enterococcus faecalis]CAC9770048.1 hypothetical protein IE183ART_02485 [Enterococcus faecalis]CAC9778492.1 hypothetical protein IE044AEMC_01489 [Enterococcus faecalis]
MDTIDLLLLITFVILAFNFVIFIFSLYMMKRRKKEFEKKLKQVDEEFRKFEDSFLIENSVIERGICIWAENLLNRPRK